MPRTDVRERYAARTSNLERLRQLLESEKKEALKGIHHIDRVTFRVKEPDSFVKKIEKSVDPPYENPLSEIEDQVAGRVIVFFLTGIDSVLTRLSGTFATVEGQRRSPPRDEEFGYESCQATSESDPLASRKLTPSPGHPSAAFRLLPAASAFARRPERRFSRSR